MSTHEQRHYRKGKVDFSKMTPEEQKKWSQEHMTDDEHPVNESSAEEAEKKLDEERSKRGLDQIPPEAL